MAVVDADYQFLSYDVGGMGSMSDASHWGEWELREALEQDLVHLPQTQMNQVTFVGSYDCQIYTYFNKESLLFLQNRLSRTFNVMFYCFLLLHLPYCFFCFLFLLFSVFNLLSVPLFLCFQYAKRYSGN